MRNFSLPLRNLAANSLRSTLTALAITVGVAMVLAASIVGEAANQRAAFDASQTEQAPSPGGAGLTPFDQPTEVNTQIVQIGLGITGVMLVFAAGFVILNAFAMTVTARQREIGALRALGMTRAQVTRSVLGEAVLLALAGVGAGIPVGLLLARAVMFAFGTLEDVPFRVPWWGLGLAITLGLVITIGAALQPARRASHVPPLRVIRPGAEDVGESSLSKKRGMTGILILVSTLVFFTILGPLLRLTIWPAVGLASLGFILLIAGTVLSLPSAVGWVARIAGKWLAARYGVAGRLAADNFRRNPVRSALTIGGIIAGLTTIIILSGVMTVLMEQGFTSFALMMREDRFVSPNIVAMFEAGEISFENMSAVTFMTAPLDPDLASELEALEQMGRIELERIGSAPIQPEFQISPGFPAVFVEPEIYLRIGNFDFFEGEAESALAMMEQGNAVLVMPLIAERFGAGLGDAIPVQTPQGEVMFTIAGIGGNGWNMPAFSLADGARYFGIEPTMLGIVIPEGQDREAVLEEVEKIIDDYPDRMLLSMQDEFLDIFDQVQGQFRALLNALLSLGVLLAGLGVVNTMVINIAERGREIGMLRAVGATRRQVRQSIVVEAAALGLMAAIISILLSFLMIATFIVVVAPNAPTSIGLRLSSELTRTALTNAGRDMATASLYSLFFAPFVATLAAYFPARQAAALNVVEATRSERLSLKTTPSARVETHRKLANSLAFLAWRELSQSRTRTILSVLAVGLGVTLTIATHLLGDALLNVFAESELARSFGQGVFDQLVMMLNLIGVAITVAAGFLVFNAFGMSVTQRRQQVGVLRSLGMTRRQVIRLVLLEGLITAVIGVAVGLIVGPLMGRGIIFLMQSLDLFINNFAASTVSLGTVLFASVLGIGVTLFSVWLPAWRAATVSPLEALREPYVSTVLRSAQRTVWVGAIMLVGIVAYLAVSPPARWVSSPVDFWLTVLFVVLWLAGIGFVLPGVIGGVGRSMVRMLARVAGTIGRLASDNLLRDRSRVTLTASTLAIAVALVVAMTGFMAFMMDTLMFRTIDELTSNQGWTVTTIDVTQGTSIYTEATLLPPEKKDAFYDAFRDRANIAEFNFVIVPELSFLGDTYFSFVLDPEVIRDTGSTFFTFSEGGWDTAMPIMQAGCGVLVPPLIANRNQAGLGDTITVRGKNGPVDCTIAGIGTSFVLASIIGDSVADQFAADQPFSLYISPKSGVDPAQLGTDIHALSDGLSLEVMTIPEFSGMLTQAFDQIRGMFNAMLLLAMVTAALAVVNTTVMSVAERRRELGLLRAVGAKRRQVTAVITLETAFIGLIGGGVGLVAGVGFAMIVVLAYGGNSWGFPDMEPWPTAWEVAQPALATGLLGLVAAPFVAALATWLPARSLTRGTAIETLTPEAHREPARRMVSGWLARGSIPTRFVVGTAVLLFIVLAAIIGFVTNHARIRMTEQVENLLQSVAEWNATALEAALPADAENISLEALQAGKFDSETMLRFQALTKDVSENNLHEYLVVDADGVVVFSLDPRSIGDVYTPEETSIQSGGRLLIPVSAPVRNEAGNEIGTVHLTMEATPINDFLSNFQRTLWTTGGVIILLSVILVGWISTPLVRATQQLVSAASHVKGGAYPQVPVHATGLRGWLERHTTLRTRLTAAMVLVVLFMVGIMELITVPTERRQLEMILKENIVSGGEWMGQLLSEDLDSLSLDSGQSLTLEQMVQIMEDAGGFDAAKLQELAERARGNALSYIAFVNMNGEIIFSDQLSLIGETASTPERATVEDDTWRDDAIWAVSIPLHRGEEGEQVGVMRMAVLRTDLDAFLDESRLLLRLFGLAAVLAAVLLAQAIGGAVTQPVRQLAADTRRVAQGDLAVQFRVDTKDEMAVLATAFNEMVVGLREREWLRDMFGRFVSQEVAEAIRTGQVRLEGENRVVSVLFCDIRGFTARSEQHTPEEIVALLNEYLPVVVDAAQAHRGTVNKFGGDSTLVIYGAPRQLEESAYQAVLTALDMRANLRGLNEQLSRRGEEPIRIGVGINTGMALAGAVGPEARQEYTVIGDTVNLASRIEALNKEFPEYDILISGQTYDALGSRRAEFAFVDLGEMAIRGKAVGVRVWAVVGTTPL